MRYAVVCILYGDGLYDEDWVYRLKKMVDRHVTLGHDFICLTDREREAIPGVKYQIFDSPLPGHFKKLELFKHGVFGDYDRVLYLDLDVVILGNLDAWFGYPQPFVIASVPGPHRPKPKRILGFQASVMVWKPGVKDYFYSELAEAKNNGKDFTDWLMSDQDWIKYLSPAEKTFPEGTVVKLYSDEQPPPPCKVALCINPKNHVLATRCDWVREHWGEPL